MRSALTDHGNNMKRNSTGDAANTKHLHVGDLFKMV